MLKQIKIAAYVLMFYRTSYSQDNLIERVYTFESEKESVVEAKKEIQDLANQKIIEEFTTELIGDNRYKKKKKEIDQLLLPRTSRFIPLSRITDTIQEAGKFKQTLTLKISLNDFRNLLKTAGLLEEIDQNQSLLSFMSYHNNVVGQSYLWWLNPESSLKGSVQDLEENMGDVFLKNGFYLISTNQKSMFERLSNVKKEDLSLDDQQKIALKLKCPFLMNGKIEINRSEKQMNKARVEITMNLFKSENLRPLTNIKRVFEMNLSKDAKKFETDWTKRLREEIDQVVSETAQVTAETIQKGLLNSQKIKLVYLFPSTPLKIEWLKEKLKQNVGSIKAIKERSISSSQIVFEADYVGNIKDIQERLLQMDVKMMSFNHVELKSSSAEELNFEIK